MSASSFCLHSHPEGWGKHLDKILMWMWSKWLSRLSDVICICASEYFRNPNIKLHNPLILMNMSGYVLIPQPLASINSTITSARISKKRGNGGTVSCNIMQDHARETQISLRGSPLSPVSSMSSLTAMASRIHPLWGIQHQQLLDKVSPQQLRIQPHGSRMAAAWQQFAQIKIERYAEWGTHGTHTYWLYIYIY